MDFLKITETLISYFLPLILLLICGLFFTLKGGFFQITKLPRSLKLIVNSASKSKKQNNTTSFQSVCTSLAATVGTGNIAGVAGAVSIGGAGAVFWMWISAFLGMAIKYAEITLAVNFRKKERDSYVGGPMYYIKENFPEKAKFIAAIFTFSGIFATFFSGNVTQSNAVILSFECNLQMKIFIGVVFSAITYAVILGGAKRIGAFTEKVVPLMSVIYIFLSLVIIIKNANMLPFAFKQIFLGAFNPKAVTGGCVGSVATCIFTGVSRGVFSNEAGLGTSAMAHSCAFDAKTETQGLFGIFEVFIDTLVICTLTALTILCGSVNINYGNVTSSQLISEIFSKNFDVSFTFLFSAMMCFFGFSSIIGWALYGNICSNFLFGKTGEKIFQVIYPAGCFLGAISTVKNVWRISQFFNGIMLCINLVALIFLSDVFLNILKGRKYYEK